MGVEYVQLVRDSWASRIREFMASPFGQGTGMQFFEAHEPLPRNLQGRVGYFPSVAGIEFLLSGDFTFGTLHDATDSGVDTHILVLANTDPTTARNVEEDGNDSLFTRYVADLIAQGAIFTPGKTLWRKEERAAEARTLVEKLKGHVFTDPKGRRYYSLVTSIPSESITPDRIYRKAGEDKVTIADAVYELALWPLILWFHGPSRKRVVDDARYYSPRTRTRVQ